MDEHRFGTVVLLGAPNAGKSTLLNHVVGEKVAIVSPKPQTTRNRIRGILTTDDAQIVFVDTPGVHAGGGRMGRMLVTSAWQALSGADLAVVLHDAAVLAANPGKLKTEVDLLSKPVQEARLPVLVALNKVDKIAKPKLLPMLPEVAHIWGDDHGPADVIPLSAKTGDNVNALMKLIVERLPHGPPMYPEDELTDAPLRFMASEMVREKLFLALRDELPYQVAVEVENWDQDQKTGFTRVDAVIYAAKNSHKAMIIGKGGRLIKDIGSQARQELEELMGVQVHLALHVKVRTNWIEDAGFLREMGLGE